MWLTASVFLHPHCVISTFSTVERPGWLFTRRPLFKHECQEVNIVTLSDIQHLIFGWTATKWGPALKESLWLTNWVSDKVMQFYHWPVKCKSTELAIYLTVIFWSPSCWKLADPCPWLVDSCISTFTCSCEIIVLYRIHLQLHPLFVNPELR